MAILQDNNEEQKKTTQLDQAAPTLGGESSTTIGVSQPVQSQGPKSSAGGEKTKNLKRFVEANKPVDMANKLQSKVIDQTSLLKGNIQQSEGNLKDLINRENQRLGLGEELVQDTSKGGQGVFEKGRTAEFTSEQQPLQTEEPWYAKYGQSAEERLGEFGKYKSGQTEDIKIANEQELQKTLEDVTKKAELGKTEEGRFQLLREVFGRPDYTTGQQRLDQLLVQATPTTANRMANLIEQVNPAKESLQSLRDYSTKEKENVTSRASELSSDILTRLFGENKAPILDEYTGAIKDVGGALGAFKEDIGRRTSEATSNVQKQYNALKDIIGKGYDITPDMLQRLGVTDSQNINDFMNYYKQGQGRTLGEAVSTGALKQDELQRIAEQSGMDYSTMNSLYNALPMSYVEFVEKNKTAKLDPTHFQQAYDTYKQNLATESVKYKQTLHDYINKNLKDFRAEAPKLDFTKYLNTLSPDAISASNVATVEDYARQKALEQLAEKNLGYLTDESQADSYNQLGYGKFNIAQALNEARGFYNKPTYGNVDFVMPTIPESETLGKTLQSFTEGTLGAVNQGVTDKLQDYTGTGEIVQSVVFDPLQTGATEYLKSVTSPMDYTEEGLGQIFEGDILGGSSKLAAAPVAGAISTTTAPLSATEKLFLGSDNISNLSSDYTQTLKDISQLDFKSLDKSLQSTIKLPEQLVSSSIEKVEKVYKESLKVIADAFKPVKKFFKKLCFIEGALILMNDLTYKPIEEINPGDMIFGGGEVEVIGKAKSPEIYNYKGTKVSYEHAVFENGEWKRIKDAEHAVKDESYVEPTIVYYLISENHLMVVGDTLYSDFEEYFGSNLDTEAEGTIKLNSIKFIAQKVQDELDIILKNR